MVGECDCTLINLRLFFNKYLIFLFFIDITGKHKITQNAESLCPNTPFHIVDRSDDVAYVQYFLVNKLHRRSIRGKRTRLLLVGYGDGIISNWQVGYITL